MCKEQVVKNSKTRVIIIVINSNDDLLTTNRNKCLETFDRFLELHNICIAENRNKKHPECFGF